MENTALVPAIYLLEPLDDRNSKNKLVYSDGPANARKAASLSNDPMDRIFADRNLSTCIKVDVALIKIDEHSKKIQFKFNEVVYDLVKDKAINVLAAFVT